MISTLQMAYLKTKTTHLTTYLLNPITYIVV